MPISKFQKVSRAVRIPWSNFIVMHSMIIIVCAAIVCKKIAHHMIWQSLPRKPWTFSIFGEKDRFEENNGDLEVFIDSFSSCSTGTSRTVGSRRSGVAGGDKWFVRTRQAVD